MVLEELMGLMDEEFMDSLLFDICFQYALHTTSFKEQPVSDRTFSRFRRRCLTYETETGIDRIHDTGKELSGKMAGKSGLRRDSKHRVLRRGESIRANGKYQFKYHIGGNPHFVYSWRLESTDPLPVGKKPCLSLRELEKQIGYDLDNRLDPLGKNITVNELVERYLKTKVGMRPNTLANYNFVRNILKNEPFGSQKISKIKTSDAKLFLIKMQQEDGRGHSTIKTVRGVLRLAFQMAVDDDVLMKNPFQFELAGVVVNDAVTREAVTKDQMRKFLKFIHDDVVYCKYYEVIYILFHTGMRISKFCGLTMRDIDLEKRTINIDHQLQRTSKREYVIEPTKTNAGTRVIPMTNEVTEMFRAIIEDRPDYKVEKVVDGYTGFLFLDKDGMPLVAMHWEHRFNHMVSRYNEIYKVQIPNITPHVCRHTYCSNMAKSGMNPKTLQYLMGHSDIAVTLNVYTHVGLEDAEKGLRKMQGLENARKEMGISDTDDKPLKQNMFKVV